MKRMNINIIKKNSHAKRLQMMTNIRSENFIFNITINREQYTKSNMIYISQTTEVNRKLKRNDVHAIIGSRTVLGITAYNQMLE